MHKVGVTRKNRFGLGPFLPVLEEDLEKSEFSESETDKDEDVELLVFTETL